MKKKKILSFFAIVTIATTVFSVSTKAAEAPASTTQSFTIQESSIADLGGNFSNDLFTYSIASTSSNGQYDGNRMNYFDFRNTFTMKSSTERRLVDFVVSYDHFYYSVNYWGSNAIGTPMNYDNQSHSFVLPTPWVVDETTTLDTSHSLSSTNNDQGVHIFVTDQNQGALNVENLNYSPKSNITDVVAQSMDTVLEINSYFGYNIKTPSATSLDSELPTIQYHVNDSLINTSIVKDVRIHQEKIGAYGLDSGRWYGMSFSPMAKYTYQYDRTMTVDTPQNQSSIPSGTEASFASNISLEDNKDTNYTYNWQVSTDGGATYQDIAGSNSLTYTFTTSDNDDGNLYRLQVIPANVVSTDKVMYSEPASLSVVKTTPRKGKVITAYQDESGTTLLPSESIEGDVDTTYHMDAKSIDGYTLVEMPSNVDGTYQTQDQTIVFVYKINSVIVTPTEELPANPAETTASNTTVKTGDSSNMLALITIGGFSLFVIGILGFKKVKKNLK